MGDVVCDTAGAASASCRIGRDTADALSFALPCVAVSSARLGVIGLALLVPLHVIAALKHHFWDRDDTVRGILPEIRDDETAPDHKQYTPRVG